MTLDELKKHAVTIANEHVGMFSDFTSIKAEIFRLVIELINHVQILEGQINAKAAPAVTPSDHVPHSNS